MKLTNIERRKNSGNHFFGSDISEHRTTLTYNVSNMATAHDV